MTVYVFAIVFNQFPQSDRERELFSLAGPDNTTHRMTIYQFLLSHMTDEHRFQLTTKLCHEVGCYCSKIKCGLRYKYNVDDTSLVCNVQFLLQILGGVVDGVIVLEDDSTHLIKDTLAILTCKVGRRDSKYFCGNSAVQRAGL